MKNDSLCIAYSADDNYSKLMAVSIISVCENNRNFKHINFYCLEENMSINNKKEIIRIVKKYRRKITFIDIKNLCDIKRFWNKERDTMFSRILIPELIEEEKVLYLDCDLIVVDSLENIWSENIENYACFAVQDTSREKARLESGNNDIRYFNSGVLIINCGMWKEKKLYEKMERYEKTFKREAIFPDQRPLNAVVLKYTKLISPRYNLTPEYYRYNYKQLIKIMGNVRFYSEEEVKSANDNPAIIHFSGRTIDRPWYKNNESKYRSSYLDYMNKDEYTKFSLLIDKKMIKWKIKYRLPFFVQLMVSKVLN